MTRDLALIYLGSLICITLVFLLNACAERTDHNVWDALDYGVPQRTEGPHNY